MGKTSKPVHLIIDQSIMDAAPETWKALADQGHSVEVMKVVENTVLVAPYAMRMTAAMVKDLPKAIELLIKGARTLQSSPLGGADWTKGKPKRVANKNKAKGKNSTKPVENNDSTSEPASGGTGQAEGATVEPVGETSHIEGNGQDTGR